MITITLGASALEFERSASRTPVTAPEKASAAPFAIDTLVSTSGARTASSAAAAATDSGPYAKMWRAPPRNAQSAGVVVGVLVADVVGVEVCEVEVVTLDVGVVVGVVPGRS